VNGLGIVKKTSTTITRDDYNNMVIYVGGPSANNTMFDSDLQLNTAAKGLIVWTPDGLHKYRIRVDNSGNLVTELA
jgi:hypothetical protein